MTSTEKFKGELVVKFSSF